MEQIQAYKKALETYNKENDTNTILKDKNTIAIQELSQKFANSFSGDSTNYASAFIFALELELALNNISEEEYSDKRADYARLGETYYLFNDLPKSISLLKKAITNNAPRSFTDRANLDARKIIGICYANLGEIDMSDYYFRSILESHDIILDRPIYNAYAMSYLGCNAMMRQNYAKALILDNVVLPFFRTYSDYGHLAGMFYCRSTAYYNLGDIIQSGLAADSTLLYANQDKYHSKKRRKQAFSALIRYNAVIGNATQTKAYSDSLVSIYKQEDFEYTSLYIANAKEIIYKQNMIRAEEQAVNYRKNIVAGTLVSLMIFLLVAYTFVQYFRLRTAYRALVRKSNQWAEQISKHYKPNIRGVSESSVNEETRIIQQIHDYVITKKNYLDTNLSLDKLSKELNINRSYLSSAINNVMDKNFSAYVNEYRISEAIKMLNDGDNKQIEELIIACGFNNKNSFYNYFKKITGITPGEYRTNLEKRS